MLESKLSGSKPPARELKTFSQKTNCLFREWDKLTIDSDGILYRTTTVRKQLQSNTKEKYLKSFTITWDTKVLTAQYL